MNISEKELDETIDYLLETGAIVMVGYDETGEPMYAGTEWVKKNMTNYKESMN